MTDYFTELKKSRQEEGITDLFLSHIHGLISINYTQSEIASHLSVSTTTVSKWLKREYTAQPTELPEPKQKPYSLSSFEQSNLKDLARKASRVSRNTPPNAPSRVAANTLESQLQHYINLNTPISSLAKAAGVSRRSIYQRMEKYR